MPNLAELREKGQAAAKEIRELSDLYDTQERQWKDDQEKKYDDANKRYDESLAAIDREQKDNAIEERLNSLKEDEARFKSNPKPIPGFGSNVAGGKVDERAGEITDEDRCEAMAAWTLTQMDEDITQRQQEICDRLKFNPQKRKLQIKCPHTMRYQQLQAAYRSAHPSRAKDTLLESRAMSAFTAGTGGTFIPASFLSSLEINMLAFGGIRQVADMMVTSTGEPLTWPGVDDTGNMGEQLGESTIVGDSVQPTTKSQTWNAYKFSSKPVLVPYELMRDSAFNLVQILGELLGERLGRITSQRQTIGSGAGTCEGLMTGAQLGLTAGSATAITADEIIDLQHAVDPAYRSGAGFMCHDSVVKHLRKLKDADGQYLWGSGLRDNVPDSINGAALTINQDMDGSVASGKKTLAYGQMSKYKIRRVGNIRLYRMEERYRDQDQDGFVAFIEEDGKLLNMGTCPVKYLQQA